MFDFAAVSTLLQGTGIVTSVPSDAPDDYAALMDLGEFFANAIIGVRWVY